MKMHATLIVLPMLFASIAAYCQQSDETGQDKAKETIRGKHHRYKRKGLNGYAFDALSIDLTVGYGAARSAQYMANDLSTTYMPVTAYVRGGFPLIGKDIYYSASDKGLVMGYDIIPGLGFGPGTHTPSTSDILDKYVISEVVEFGLYGIYRFNKNYDLGAALLWGYQGSSAQIHDLRQRGCIANIHGRVKRWYFDYERFIARSKVIEKIYGDAPGYLTYPVMHNITVKYAINKRHYLKFHTEFAMGHYSETITSYPHNSIAYPSYSNEFASVGFGWFVR